MTTMVDPISLTQDLVRCPSVTPAEAGALSLCEAFLKSHKFQTWRLPFGEVDNLFARIGTTGPHLCFAGHIDVVPAGDESAWTHPPFSAVIAEGQLFGRGAEDMKGSVAAALAAAADFLAAYREFDGSISFLLTGDEEGPAINGTAKVLDWMAEHHQIPDQCIIMEPTAVQTPGDTLKIGRRGSLNGLITVSGKQGHVAYPNKADNPLPRLLDLLKTLITRPLDEGTPYFEPSSLQITSIDVGNPAPNVIPESGQASFNSRFNDLWTPETLTAELKARLDTSGFAYDLNTRSNALAFMTPAEKFANPLAKAIQQITGQLPTFSTAGGTSDARFVQAFCPVVEMGLVGRTMHQVNESVPVEHIKYLKILYQRIMEAFIMKKHLEPH